MAEASVEVDEAALRAAIRVWIYTPIIRLHTVAGERQDLYLKLVAHAAQLPYEKVVELWHARNRGIVDARRQLKRMIFAKLMNDPPSILRVHDEVVVHEASPVESEDVAEEQGHEDRPR
jgi:hypothetical protein